MRGTAITCSSFVAFFFTLTGGRLTRFVFLGIPIVETNISTYLRDIFDQLRPLGDGPDGNVPTAPQSILVTFSWLAVPYRRHYSPFSCYFFVLTVPCRQALRWRTDGTTVYFRDVLVEVLLSDRHYGDIPTTLQHIILVF